MPLHLVLVVEMVANDASGGLVLRIDLLALYLDYRYGASR
jgi:hypothetical protein